MLVLYLILILILSKTTDQVAQNYGDDDDDDNLDYQKFIVWGPGLRADFFMPVRYFYIQTVDRNSNK